MTYSELQQWARNIFTHARGAAKKRGIEFGLTEEDYAAIFTRSGGCCEVSGIAFDERPADGRRRPFAASLDRINSALGYTTDNCRMVTVIANFAMHEWGERTLLRLALGVVRTLPCAMLDEMPGEAPLPIGIKRRETKSRGTRYHFTVGANHTSGPYDSLAAAVSARSEFLTVTSTQREAA